jgi:hypothetical protein
MKFYDLPKTERERLVQNICNEISDDFKNKKNDLIAKYFSDEDTFIRKTAYQSTGKIYFSNIDLRDRIIKSLEELFGSDTNHIRQTVINSAGEIGIKDFSTVENFLEKGLVDPHHSVRNAVIGSLKKICEKNFNSCLPFIRRYLHNTDAEIRREICHGLELRGRMHPEDILPLLKELQYEKIARVRNNLIHVIGQISYKKGCLEKVIENLKTWENKEVVSKALDEILVVHNQYRNFSFMTRKEAEFYIAKHFKK